MAYESSTTRAKPAYTLPSILSIVSAIASFASGAGLGFLLAVAAIVLGAFGVILSAMPSNRGGMVSVAAILLGAIGVIAAFIKLLI